MSRLCLVFCLAALAASCGGGGGSSGPSAGPTPPGAPLALEANSGDGAMSLGWSAPTSDGGAAIAGYALTISPSIATENVSLAGTTAFVRGLTNGATYTVSVSARNSAGVGAASASVPVTPSAVAVGSYAAISIAGDASPTGIFDPSVLKTSATDVWMAYSGVDYRTNALGQTVRDVAVKLARSPDGGQSYAFVRELGTPRDTSVTDATRLVCGATTCSGRWIYETAWLADDATDPDPARRFKLFAHKYFLYPPTNSTLYYLGAIVMWTAPSPDGIWSAETSLLGWNLTPPELAPRINVNALDAALAPCLVVGEGGVSVRAGVLDFVFNCPYTIQPAANPLPQKIVMLRTRDHASSFQYVSTPLQPADAAPLGAGYYTAPSLIPSPSGAPLLVVTPAYSGIYSGCAAFAFSNVETGTLFRDNGVPQLLLRAPAIGGHFGGACAWDRGLASTGVLLNDLVVSPVQFRILATRKSL